MSGQIEVRMIGEINWCWSGCRCGELYGKCIIFLQFKSGGSNDRPRIAPEIIWIDMCHYDFCFFSECRPVEFVEANVAAMQMMNAVPILINVVGFSIENKTTMVYAIADSANGCSKIRIAVRLETWLGDYYKNRFKLFPV